MDEAEDYRRRARSYRLQALSTLSADARITLGEIADDYEAKAERLVETGAPRLMVPHQIR